ncbi:MAG TPA: tetraacyldisaccharide 4'-kinase, partial [Gemmatimonadaceae bacterium]
GSIVSLRNTLYDRGLLRAHGSAIPVVSVGNVTVGGTGKTPFSAYIVRALLESGHRPAVVMRGYGNDEMHLHPRMNPGTLVFTGADRMAGIHSAVRAGADVVVLDDGFQHRRARRDLDFVLVSAEQWHDHMRLLPAGPLREPLRSLARADLVVVTQKSANDDSVSAVMCALEALPARLGVVVAAIEPIAIVSAADAETVGLASLRDERILAVAGVGDPGAFFAQLRQLGAIVTERRFPDHHDYSGTDAQQIVSESSGHKYVITTEKDAVKLSTVWPADGPLLWYLSQAVRLREGASLVATALANLFERATSIA